MTETAEAPAPRVAQNFLETTDPVRLRLRTLTRIRWVAVAGQAATILVVHYGLGFELPLVPALAVVAASVLLNLTVERKRHSGAHVGESAAAWYLAFDIVQLAALLYLTGGLENPFAFLLLAPVTVSATVLSLRSTVALCLLSLVCITVLAVDHGPLPWASGGLALPKLYVLGAWVALALGIAFFTSYTWRVAQEARDMSNALSATHLALAREQQLSALGGLAAAAAHELGSPLGTIAVATREIARELPDDSPIAEDVELLISETARCRDILAELARHPESGEGSAFTRIPIDALVDAASSRHATERVRIHLDAGPASDAEPGNPAPSTTPSAEPEILHGLGNLIQNAVQFADADVRIVTRWSATEVSVTIHDDGPGFPSRLLDRLGEPYFSARADEGQHMGLGIFIARTLLERTGASITFANRRQGGAESIVRWDRVHFRPTDGTPD